MAVVMTQRSMGTKKTRDLRYFFATKYSLVPAEPDKVDESRQRTTSPDRKNSSSKHTVASATPRELRSLSKHVVASATPPGSENLEPGSSVASTNPQGLGFSRPSYSRNIFASAISYGSESPCISGLCSKPKSCRFPGAMEPIWPPKEMIHIKPQVEEWIVPQSRQPRQISHFSLRGRKMKYAKVQIPAHEEILGPYVNLTHAKREASANPIAQSKAEFRRPRRRIMTGVDLQNAIRRVLVSVLPQPASLQESEDHEEDELASPNCSPSAVHSALLHVYQDIPNSLTAFDKFVYEKQDWVHKYAPKRAEEILQPGREALILRDWLKSLTVSSVENGIGDGPKAQDSSTAGRAGSRVNRKKRKRAEDMDDFLVSSEDEADQMGELIDVEDSGCDVNRQIPLKRSVVRGCGNVMFHGQKAINAIVISGPHGCGKTAAVFAAAQEIGFEVFEINAGSRRSGKDVLDKVGDMTRNHLVNHAQEREGYEDSEESFEPTESLKNDLESGRQATVNSFFKPKINKKQKGRSQSTKTRNKQSIPSKQQQSQKQSLILLEEVDVLFEEDKHFWATTLDLLISSKRPIVMTCTDESLLPLEEMFLFAILRFTAPPEHLAIDYLLLVACNEGHLLSRSAVSTLLEAKSYDLRASMTELNFFCQMAIGDAKGGLEWMLIRSSTQKPPNEIDQTLRVVSDGSYLGGMGCLNHERQDPGLTATSNNEVELRPNYGSMDGMNSDDRTGESTYHDSRGDAFERLTILDLALDCISSADTLRYSNFRDENATILDTTLPALAGKSRANFVDGPTLLSTEPVVDHAGVSTALALALETFSKRLLSFEDIDTSASTLTKHSILPGIPDQAQNIHRTQITRFYLSTAVDPIARSLKLPLTLQKGPHISTFNGPISVIVEELAPYVRSIVSYDLRLEEQRRQRNSSLSQGRREGKMRTTRASRAALEGGDKKHVRRERWFPPETDFSLILQLGGRVWQDILWQRTQHRVAAESRQDSSPAASVTSSGS